MSTFYEERITFVLKGNSVEYIQKQPLQIH